MKLAGADDPPKPMFILVPGFWLGAWAWAKVAGPLRAAFLKPLFLIMMMVRFHALIENQPINQEWDARLATVSDKFRDLGKQAVAGFA